MHHVATTGKKQVIQPISEKSSDRTDSSIQRYCELNYNYIINNIQIEER